MKSLITFYSKTGKCRYAAQQIANTLHADIEELHEHTPRKGVQGFISGIIQAISKSENTINKIKKNVSDYDTIIIGTPVWAARMTPAVRSFLQSHKSLLKGKRLAFFCTYGISPRDTFKEMEKLIECSPVCSVSISERDFAQQKDREKIQQFIQSLS